jgi:hypothetical protein
MSITLSLTTNDSTINVATNYNSQTYSFTIPTNYSTIYGSRNLPTAQFVFTDFSYNYNNNLYSGLLSTTYLSDATLDAPNSVEMNDISGNININLSFYSYIACSTSGLSSFTGTINATNYTLYFITTTTIPYNPPLTCANYATFNQSNVNLTNNTQYVTTYNFYLTSSPTSSIVTIIITSTYLNATWTPNSIVITNNTATTQQLALAIGFLSNLFYGTSYSCYNTNQSAKLPALFTLSYSLAPILELFLLQK